MPKAWDIVGVKRQKPKSSPAVSKKSRKNCFLTLLIILFLVVIIGTFGKMGSDFFTQKPTTPTPSASQSAQKTLALEILNGSGRYDETDKVADLITKAGYKATKVENSITMYDKTVVYYQPGYEKDAATLAKALTSYNATSQTFSNTSSYNIAIVIGTR